MNKKRESDQTHKILIFIILGHSRLRFGLLSQIGLAPSQMKPQAMSNLRFNVYVGGGKIPCSKADMKLLCWLQTRDSKLSHMG